MYFILPDIVSCIMKRLLEIFNLKYVDLTPVKSELQVSSGLSSAGAQDGKSELQELTAPTLPSALNNDFFSSSYFSAAAR